MSSKTNTTKPTDELNVFVTRAVVRGQDFVRVELQAPNRPPLTPDLALVLDRSGSMAGRKLDEARAAGLSLLAAFPAAGRLAVVGYNHNVEIGGLTREAAREYLGTLEAHGTTALHAGWKRGVTLLSDERRPRFVFLLSDGLANVGLTDRKALAQEALEAARNGVYTFTLGFGDRYDRELLAQMARLGGGTHQYVADGELAEAFFHELAFVGRPVNLGARVSLNQTEIRLSPFAALERRSLLLPTNESNVLEVGERLPKGEVLYALPVPEPAPEGSPDWLAVELDLLLLEAAKLLERRPTSPSDAKELQARATEMAETLRGHPLAEDRRLLSVMQALMTFAEAMERLASRYDARWSERVAREGLAYGTSLSSFDRVRTRKYRDRTKD